MELGQLPAEADGPVGAEDLGHVLQGGQQLVGSLVEDHGAVLLPQGFQMLPPAFLGGGQEALKAEAARGLAGDAQGGDDGAGAGNGADGDACLGTLAHQILAGIGNGGRPRIGNQSAGFSCQDPVQDHIALGGLVMLKVADQALLDAQVVQQFHGDPGILRGNKIRLLQGFPAADGNIPQISNGGGDKIEHAWHDCILRI